MTKKKSQQTPKIQVPQNPPSSETTNLQQEPLKTSPASPAPSPTPLTPKKPDPSLIQFEAVYGYICTQWGPHAAAMSIRTLTDGCSAICPPSILWSIPSNLDISPLVYDMMRNKAWLRSIWPVVYTMMKTNMGNLSWISMVICGFAYYRVLLALPSIVEHHIKLNAPPAPKEAK